MKTKKCVSWVVLVPEPFLDLSQPDLASQAEIPAPLLDGQFGHLGDLLAALIAVTVSVLFHMAMVARRGCDPKAGE